MTYILSHYISEQRLSRAEISQVGDGGGGVISDFIIAFLCLAFGGAGPGWAGGAVEGGEVFDAIGKVGHVTSPAG